MFRIFSFYTVYLKPGHRPDRDFPEFVREGFNLYAFLFTLLWTFYHRLWLASLIIFTFNLIVMYLEQKQILTEGSSFIILFAFQFVIGFHANDWLRDKLKARGYIMADIVTGENRMRAEQRFFDRYADALNAGAA